MKEISLSLNLTYLCNFRCDFCYLTKKQLADKKKVDLDLLKEKLEEISKFRKITKVDLYGGEIALLPYDYLYEFDSLVRNYYEGPINIITNLSIINPYFLSGTNTLSVSWDEELRQDHQKVLKNIENLDKEVHILMLASPKMLKWSQQKVDEVIEVFNQSKNIQSVEIKPYSENQANSFEHKYSDFESLLKKWIDTGVQKSFNFINNDLIHRALDQKSHSWSDDHLYINPKGSFCVLEFDEMENEYFLELQSFEEYINWCDKEKSRVHSNKYCSKCKYIGKCLSEHLKEVKSLDFSCNGFYNLLEYYAQRS